MTAVALPSIPFRSLQTRILAFFLLLMVVVQIGGFMLINTVGMTAARKTAGDDLTAGARVFDRLFEQDTQRIVQGARLMAADYAFGEVISTGDRQTIDSVLVNYRKRIDAAMVMVIDLDQWVVGDTLHLAVGKPFAFPKLIAQAQDGQQASAVVLVDNQLYQLVIVPVLAPLRVAWVAVGFSVNDAFAKDFLNITRIQVSFLSKQGNDGWRLQASTLAPAARASLMHDMAENRFASSDAQGNAVYGDAAITRLLHLPARGDESVVAVLQEPMSLALEPFVRLQRQLALISLLAVVVSIVASVLVARGIARPVRDLASVARRIAAGDYSTAPSAPRSDELGELASAFRIMQEGIASRESHIMDLAYRDTLTGLPNRSLYAYRLDEALAAAAPTGAPVAVLLMDLDHFKYFNDTLGHPIGDLLLRETAARLQSVVPTETDIVARMGGDEFAVLLPFRGIDEAHRVADAVLKALEAPMILEGNIVDVRASVGVAVSPYHGDEKDVLLRRADVAMYAAKRSSVGVVVWDQRYDQHSSARLSLLGDLRKAVDNNELTLMYQPKVLLRGGGAHHAEALVRWRHPTRGLVPAVEFIPFAEQTGYIRAITQWVLARAIAQCADWRCNGLPMNVSINLSARDLMDGALPDQVAALLQLHACAAQWITLEITETAILDDPAHAIANLERLHALGCKLAIDDYGTGYSSLACLRRLPVHELKIDKSFVIGMGSDASDALIVRSTIDLAHNLGLSVVAEGVENDPTLERLRSMNCDMVQGCLLSRPLGVIEIEAWMRGSVWTRAPGEITALRRVV